MTIRVLGTSLSLLVNLGMKLVNPQISQLERVIDSLFSFQSKFKSVASVKQP